MTAISLLFPSKLTGARDTCGGTTIYVSGPEHPPSPYYVPGPEEPELAPLSPNYIPELEYPEYLTPSDAEAPMEDPPLPDDASPVALSPGYIDDSDPEEDPEEDHADYPANGGDDVDDESSDDDDEEQEASEDDDEEEDEHSALADSSAVSVDDLAPLSEDTEAFETDESIPTPIPSPPLPLPSPPTTSPTYAEAYLGYKAVEIWLRVASPSTYHHPSEIPSPPLLLPSTSHKDDIPEVDMPLWKRARFTAPTSGFEVGKSLAAVAARQPRLDVATIDATLGRPMYREVGYGIEDVWDDMVGEMEERAPTTLEDLSQRVTYLSTTLVQDTHEIYVRLEDAQDD
ncbi:hypothetical protein Tco_1318761 [Tanacetum coccineum]